MKKLIAILLAMCVVLGCTACTPGGEVPDLTKTVVYVSHFNGGYGSEWIREMEKDFEEKYDGYSFEEGKSGVDIYIKNHKTLGSKLDILADDNYVYFLEDVDYKTKIDTGAILDITDVVDGSFDINTAMNDNTLPDVDESEKKIIDKFTDIQKDALNVGGSYYTIPHYEGYYGLTYDHDLFEKKSLYIDNRGNVGAKKSDGAEYLSKGPDGISGTYDDGLPATYEEFFELCEVLYTSNITPVIWSGEYQFYITNTINALITDYNGYENEKLFYNYEGTTDKYIVGWEADGTPKLGEKEIGLSTGYEVFKQAGYYYGLSFLKTLVSSKNGGYMYKSNFTDGYTHTMAQNQFLLNNKNGEQDIAMLADGIWWANEARGMFDQMELTYDKAGMYDRDLRFMPLPKATDDEVGKGLTLLESQKSFMMIRSDIPEKYVPICKLFLQFCNTQENLEEWNVQSNTPKALQYEISEANFKRLTPFAQSILTMKNDENTKVIYQLSTQPLFADNMTLFKKHESLAYGAYEAPSNALYGNKTLTAKDYYEGLAKSWAAKWENSFGRYWKD